MTSKALPQQADDASLADDAFALETMEDLFSAPKLNRLRKNRGALCDSQGHSIGIRIDEQV